MNNEIKFRIPISTIVVSFILTGTINTLGNDFMVRGFANSSFVWEDGGTTFGNLGLSPIFLWETDRILVESELEITATGSHGAELALPYLSLNYDLTSGLRGQVGKLLLPFGIFGPRLHPSWINKLPTAPMGFSHDDLVPMSDLGAALRGIIPFENFRFGYSVYLTNGPQIATDTMEVGMLRFGMEDNNTNKALGGRLELVYLSQETLEIGLSGMLGEAGEDALNSMAILGAVDFSYQRPSTLLHGMIDLKSQANWIQVDRKDYGIGTPFQNQSWNYVGQLAYRPAFTNLQWIRNLEAVGRFAQLQYAPDAPWNKEGTEWALGLNYWLTWNSLIKVAWIKGSEDHGMPGMNGMSVQNGASSAASGEHRDGKLVVQMAIGL